MDKFRKKHYMNDTELTSVERAYADAVVVVK